MAALITFNAADINLEGIEVDVDLPASWLTRALVDTDVMPREGEEQSGTVRGRLSRSGNDIVVRARVKARVALPCVRCLDPAPIDVDAELSLLLQPKRNEGKKRSRRERAEEYEFESEEADLDTYDGENVVLDAFVRELILLEVPSFPLCRESCPGISTGVVHESQEQARALDPRLAPLSAFRENDGPATIEDLVAAANQRGLAFGRKPVLRSNHAKKAKAKKKKR